MDGGRRGDPRLARLTAAQATLVSTEAPSERLRSAGRDRPVRFSTSQAPDNSTSFRAHRADTGQTKGGRMSSTNAPHEGHAPDSPSDVRALPARPNLEFERKQAKKLLALLRRRAIPKPSRAFARS